MIQSRLARLPQSSIMAYACTAFGISIFMQAVNVMVPQLYAKELGIDLAKVGIALFFIRVFDAVSDQVVGYLSDRTRTRFGARKPWIVVGTVVTLFSCYYLFRPGPGADIGYFILWRMVYDIGWTMTEVSYKAWGAELSPDYKERARITGYAGVFTNLGVLVKNVAPIAFFYLGVTQTSAFTLEQFGNLFWFCLFAVPVLTSISLIGAPAGEPASLERPDLKGAIRSLSSNRPFWFYLVAFGITWLGQGMITLMFTFYDSYLKVGQWYPYMMVGYGAVAVVATPVWVWAVDKIGKHKAYCIAIAINVLAIQAFWFLDPAAHSQATVAAIGTVVLFFIAFGAACTYVAPPAMLADVVDYGTWKTGEARAGSYFAFYALIQKMATAFGTGLGFLLLSLFHYQVKAGSVNTAFSNMGLLITIVAVPATLKGIGGMMIWRFPLDQRRHDILRRRLAGRRVQEAVAVPVVEPGAVGLTPRPAGA